MSDEASQVARAEPQPFFADIDVPCPQCGYNLRGLIEPRCPECGEPFDPEEAIWGVIGRPPGPSLLWALPRVLRHPVRFWSAPEVLKTGGPGAFNAGMFCVIVGMLVLLLNDVLLASCWLDRRLRPIGLWREDAEDPLFPLVVAALVAGCLMLAPWLIHAILCLPVLRLARVKGRDGAAAAVLGYSALWLVVAAPAAVTALLWWVHRPYPVRPGMGPWVQTAGLTGVAVSVAAVACWAVCLFAGGRAMAQGNGLVGIWCAASNPFWYVAAAILWMSL